MGILDELRAASERTSANVKRLLSDIENERRGALQRARWSAAIGSAIFIVAAAGGAGLLIAASGGSPTASPAGRIGVVLLDEPTNSIVQVDTSFSASSEAVSTFDINVSLFPIPARNLNSGGFETKVGFLFCGAIREGLTLVERNEGPQRPPAPVTNAMYESDTRLGDRADCDYIAVTSSSAQVLLSGATKAAFEAISGERVLYAFPGVTTTPLPEQFNGSDTFPLPDGAVVNVTLSNVPPDLQIFQSAPQVPSEGRLSWGSKVGPESQPAEYRIAGVLGDRQRNASVAVFTAGALVGVAGAALLWVTEVLAGMIPRRRRQPVALSTSCGPGGTA